MKKNHKPKSVKKDQKTKYVRILWWDHFAITDDAMPKDVVAECNEISCIRDSIGHLVDENEDRVALAQTYDWDPRDKYEGCLFIEKSLIKKRQVLR